MKKIGRNDPCPCGSGKKYKKCCLQRDEEKEVQDRNLIPHNRSHKPGGDRFIQTDNSFEEEGSAEETMRAIGRYKKIKSTDEMLEFAKRFLAEEKELYTDFAIEILVPIHNKLGLEGRHTEAVELFALLFEKQRGVYNDACSVFDKMLIYHYIFLNDLAGMETVLQRFHPSVGRSIDDYFEVLTALESSGHWISALDSCRQVQQKVLSSNEIMQFGKEELQEKLTLLTFFEHLFTERKHFKSRDELLEAVQGYSGDRKERTHYQRILDILEGNDRTSWGVDDFNYDEKGFKNLFYLSVEFVRWFEERNGLQALGVGENYVEEVISYLQHLGKKSFLRFNHNKLDEYLAILLRFPAFQKYRAMLVLEGVKEFFNFMHERGLTSTETLQEVHRSYGVLLPQAKTIIGEEIWKYSWGSSLTGGSPLVHRF